MVCSAPIHADVLKSLAAEYDLDLDDDTIDLIYENQPEFVKRVSKIYAEHRYGLACTPFYQWTKFRLLEYASDKEPTPRPEAKPDRVYYCIQSVTVVYECGPTACVTQKQVDDEGGYYAVARMRREEVLSNLAANEIFV